MLGAIKTPVSSANCSRMYTCPPFLSVHLSIHLHLSAAGVRSIFLGNIAKRLSCGKYQRRCSFEANNGPEEFDVHSVKWGFHGHLVKISQIDTMKD